MRRFTSAERSFSAGMPAIAETAIVLSSQISRCQRLFYNRRGKLPPPARNPWNSLQVGQEINPLKTAARQQSTHALRLPVSNLEQHVPARRQCRIPSRNQPPVHIEAILARKQRLRRFMLAHLHTQRLAIPLRHIRRIRNNQIELFTSRRPQQIALKKPQLLAHSVSRCILTRNGKCLR